MILIGLIGAGVVLVAGILIFLFVRRQYRLANNDDVFFLLKKQVICPYCSWKNYIRRRDTHYWCVKCSKDTYLK